MSDYEPTGAVVEIIDYADETAGILLPRRVTVNGTDVGFIATDGISLDVGTTDTPTTVTLVLMPSKVTIRSE